MTSEAHLIVDPSSGSIVFFDAAAAALFGLRDDVRNIKAVTYCRNSRISRRANLRRGVRIGSGRTGNRVRLERLRSGAFAKVGAILAIVRSDVPRARAFHGVARAVGSDSP